MRTLTHDGVELIEFQGPECKRLRMSKTLHNDLVRNYFPEFTGIVSALDGPLGILWILELADGEIQTLSAIAGIEPCPGAVIKKRLHGTITEDLLH